MGTRITWSAVGGNRVGLGTRTLTADGDTRHLGLDPAVVDVALAPGELYRAALPGGGGVDVDAATAAEVRCEGRSSPT